MAKKKQPKSNALVDVFAEQARLGNPAYESKLMVGDRELVIRVYPGDHSVSINLAGTKGGKGDLVIVPNSAIMNVAAYITAVADENKMIFERSVLI